MTAPQSTRLAAVAAMTAALSLTGFAYADPGHDHGDEAPAAATSSGVPRVASHSDLFEIVGIVDKDEMTIYLDRYASNAPVADARIEVEAGPAKGVASAQSDGTYRFKHDLLAQPGTLPVRFSVVAGQDSDLLAGELKTQDTHDSHPHEEASHPWSRWLAGAAAALAALVLSYFGMRRARRRRSAS